MSFCFSLSWLIHFFRTSCESWQLPDWQYLTKGDSFDNRLGPGDHLMILPRMRRRAEYLCNPFDNRLRPDDRPHPSSVPLHDRQGGPGAKEKSSQGGPGGPGPGQGGPGDTV